MKRVTKSRLNAVENAGSVIIEFDSFTGLSDNEIKDHHEIGQLLIKNADEVLRLLFKLEAKK